MTGLTKSYCTYKETDKIGVKNCEENKVIALKSFLIWLGLHQYCSGNKVTVV